MRGRWRGASDRIGTQAQALRLNGAGAGMTADGCCEGVVLLMGSSLIRVNPSLCHESRPSAPHGLGRQAGGDGLSVRIESFPDVSPAGRNNPPERPPSTEAAPTAVTSRGAFTTQVIHENLQRQAGRSDA